MARSVSIPSTPRELLFESFYAGVLGGSAVALFFLFFDILDGQPFFSPSLMGSVLFQGVAAQDVADARLDAVVYFSIAHIVAFTAIGAAMSFLVHEIELHSRHPVVVLIALFAIIEVGFFVVAPLAMPGVIERLGIIRVAAANLLAAGTMGLFFVLSHRAGAWKKVKHTTPELISDSLCSGLLGGSVVALFFLFFDILDGQPYFSPSLMGSVLFQGVAAQDVVDVQLSSVAYFSIAHILAFAALGAAMSFLVHRVELYSQHPVLVLVVLFAFIEVAFFVVAPLAMPGVVERLGIIRVGAANLLAAVTMALFFVCSHRAGAWKKVKHTTPELVFDSLCSGVLGGSVVALVFLFFDLLDGQAFFSPSLMGSVLFQGAAVQDVMDASFSSVVYFSLAHIFAFAALGAAMSFLIHRIELRSQHPILVLVVLFAFIEVGFFVVAPLVMPGVVERLGIARIGVANLLAAGAMALFFVCSHRAGVWEKLKHTTPDLIFDSFFSGAISGSVVALFFLFYDFFDGQLFFTPSLVGSVIFHGIAADAVTNVRLDAVVEMTIAHFIAFAAIGTAISLMVHKVKLHSQHPILVLVVLFAIIEVSFLVVAPLAMPGVIERLGVIRVSAANLLAAGAMALFFVKSQSTAEAQPSHAVEPLATSNLARR
jgi:hypothetical protein